jgi:acetone carboxylase gamma subunit
MGFNFQIRSSKWRELAGNLSVLVTEEDMSELIDNSDAANTKKQMLV